ncbi:putative outer membrane lipoprotein [Rhodoferax antarcticus ANT.BR]|uniref:Outer-membrane lipoprotein LolB n=1 Tax=Rhodoferax antarcticus ANT.BR TaxID=1111071 RepID=A0A1Q8YK74_9BURK|nr:putative outer membrane lipoprotein [Rhodoferax antarcticus ANT.BR]
MTSRRALATLGIAFATYLIAGCASTERARGLKGTETSFWAGRLSVRVQADPNQPQAQDQSFSAAFELQGNPDQGELRLYTPLGSTAAGIQWTPINAVLQAHGETRQFRDLAQLITLVLGTDVPVTALFAWLAGQNQEVDGWQVDLSARNQGKIAARRTAPALPAELQVVLDN